MDGRHPFRTTLKPWLTPLVFVGIYVGKSIHSVGFLNGGAKWISQPSAIWQDSILLMDPIPHNPQLTFTSDGQMLVCTYCIYIYIYIHIVYVSIAYIRLAHANSSAISLLVKRKFSGFRSRWVTFRGLRRGFRGNWRFDREGMTGAGDSTVLETQSDGWLLGVTPVLIPLNLFPNKEKP